MESTLILASLFLGFIILAVLIKKWLSDFSLKNNPSQDLTAWLKSTNDRIDFQNKNITSTLETVQKNIAEMSEIGRSMKDLEDFLKSPKLRGNLGELILGDLLSQLLPKNSFHLQYAFKGGATVDAAITTSNGIIPIDSKFPLENFRKMIKAENETDKKSAAKTFVSDVRKHIDDISRKYILTDEGTIDYALMYIPSEAVYYEIVNNQDLFEYSNGKRVLPVSPVTFYAYLRTILMSFEGQKIEVKAKQILTVLRSIRKDYSSLEENLLLLSKHLTNAYNQMPNVSKSVTHLGQKISSSDLLPEGK